MLPRADGAPRAPPARRGAALLAALGQDRRLPGGLRLLPADGALRHRASSAEQLMTVERGARRGRAKARAAGATRFCMGAAWREVKDGPAFESRARDGARRARAGHGGVRARSACSTTSRPQRLKEAGLDRLQPQPRHLARVLRVDHHHAHLRRSAAHAAQRARGGHHGLLRRHHRHGRVDRRSLRDAAHARQPRSAPGERADQRAGAGRGDAARRAARPSSRWSWCA